MKSVNETSLRDLYKTAHMALASIDDVSKSTQDVKIKEELAREYEGYEQVIGKLAQEMLSREIQPKEPNVLKKAMLWSSIKINTLTDDSKSHIAEMMIQGTTMGLTEVMTLMSENGEIMDKPVKDLAEELKTLMDGYLEELKKYL